jgi:RNA polymerase sigma-70 factor (ECF subfamily)
MLAAELTAEDLSALDGIWELCGNDLFGLAHWRTASVADAEDVVQEVFVSLARYPQALQKARRPWAYLLTMTHNAAAGLLKKRSIVNSLDEVPFLECRSRDAAAKIDAERVSALLNTLPEVQRTALFLRFFQGLGFRDIGRVTGVSVFTAASRCRLGIWRLRKLMGVQS